MSELTQCNFCSLRTIERKAKAAKKQVSTIYNKEHGGMDVFVHPKKVKISQENKPKEYFVAWFMELSTHCVC